MSATAASRPLPAYLVSLNSKLGSLIDLAVFHWRCVHNSCMPRKMDGHMYLRGLCALHLTDFRWSIATIRRCHTHF
jgi:hypothetical protein